MTIIVSSAESQQRIDALKLLFTRFPQEDQASRLAEALNSAERGCLNLDGLLLASENGRPAGAAMTMRQSDGVTLVWSPVVSPESGNAIAVADALMLQICEDIESVDSKLAQALLGPEDDADFNLLSRFGFEHLADLFFNVRKLSDDDLTQISIDEGIDHEIFTEGNHERFAKTVERTYEGSLDCPFLTGFRNGEDALISHRLSGTFDPAGWRLYQVGSKDVGIVLMNEHPEQDAIELVYFGIVPEFRGRGLGRRILTDSIQGAAMTGRAMIFLAVDCGNTYANKLYDDLGFQKLVRRRVMIRRCSQLARE